MATTIELSDEDVAFLLTLLRNSPRPMATHELIEALRNQSGRT